jgi:hypothetical protein
MSSHDSGAKHLSGNPHFLYYRFLLTVFLDIVSTVFVLDLGANLPAGLGDFPGRFFVTLGGM